VEGFTLPPLSFLEPVCFYLLYLLNVLFDSHRVFSIVAAMTGNWFERYSITGTYFVIITALWLYSITAYTDIGQSQYVGIMIISILPLGFIIANFSGWLYYHTGQFRRNIIYHPQILKQVAQDLPLEDLKNQSEFAIETELTIRFRLSIPEGQNPGILERIKWYSDVAAKRWDIFAISMNLMLATILSFVLCLLSAVGLACFTYAFHPIYFMIGMIAVIEGGIFIILCWIRAEMFKQVVNRIQRLYKFLYPSC
jgi:hypothetical protein